MYRWLAACARGLHRALLPICLLVTVPSPAITPQKKPVILRNGEAVDLRGTIAIEHRGWNQFLVLRTPDPYALVPNAMVATLPVPHPVVHEFGLTLAGQDDRLASLAGKTIRVSGRLQFAPESPALWNGTMVWATVAGLPGGGYLDPKRPEPGVPLTVHRYTATTTLRPGRWARTYTARDLETRRPLTQTNLAGCRPAPEGDVLNCSCSDGFRPYAAALHTAGATLKPTMTGTFARFAVGDPGTTPIIAEVECARVSAATPVSAARQRPDGADTGTSAMSSRSPDGAEPSSDTTPQTNSGPTPKDQPHP